MGGKKRGESKGFSLTELLVVVVIFGILLAFAIPAISNQIRKSESLTCQSNLRQLGLAMEQYAQDHNGLYPPPSQTGGGGGAWHQLLFPYVENGEEMKPNKSNLVGSIFECPSAARDFQARGLNQRLSGWVSYGMNRALPSYGGGEQAADEKTPLRIDNPSQTCLLIENDNGIAAGNGGMINRVEAVKGRHDGMFNILFCDGHVESRKFDEIPQLPSVEGRQFWKGIAP